MKKEKNLPDSVTITVDGPRGWGNEAPTHISVYNYKNDIDNYFRTFDAMVQNIYEVEVCKYEDHLKKAGKLKDDETLTFLFNRDFHKFYKYGEHDKTKKMKEAKSKWLTKEKRVRIIDGLDKWLEHCHTEKPMLDFIHKVNKFNFIVGTNGYYGMCNHKEYDDCEGHFSFQTTKEKFNDIMLMCSELLKKEYICEMGIDKICEQNEHKVHIRWPGDKTEKVMNYILKSLKKISK